MSWSFAFAVPGGGWVALALGVLCGVVVAAGLRELRAVREPRRRYTLGGLRVVTGLVAWLLASQPQWSAERVRQVDGNLAVLADVSRSMSVTPDGERTRADRARALMQRWRDEPIRRNVSVHTFGRDVSDTSLEKLAKRYPAAEDDTRIEAAIRSLARADEAAKLGAIVMVSDGADLTPRWTASRLKDLNVKVHTVNVGHDAPLRDDSIVELHADSVAFLRQEAQVALTVRSAGGGARQIPVTLRRGDEVIREVLVDVPADGTQDVEIPFVPRKLGRALYRVSIPVEADDAVPRNNQRAFLVQVTRDKLRVLLVCGAPSWDARFLREMLKSDPSVDLITFFILRTTSDLTMASPDELSLIPFPTDELFRQHLDSFDVVLFQNFEFGPYRMAQHLPRIRDYVRDGGSFAMIGGDQSFSQGGYGTTPIAEVLPVELVTGAKPEPLVEAFRPKLTETGARHPIVALLPDPLRNRSQWSSLAPVFGLNRVQGARPEAQTLLAHPRESNRDGEPLPVLVVGRHGEGRTMALTIDSSWRWGLTTAGRRGDVSAHERFWDRGLRWLSKDPSLDPSRLRLSRERYGPGATGEAHFHLRDESYRPLAMADIELRLMGDRGRVLAQHEARTDAEGRGSLTFSAPQEPGGYRLEARLAEGGEALADQGFVVETGGDELADPRARPDVLREIAAVTGGEHYETPDDVPALDAMEATRARSLGLVTQRPFTRIPFLLLVGALFVAEWALRRAWGRR